MEQMEITLISKNGERLSCPEGAAVKDVLEGLGINLETVLVRVNGAIKAEDFKLKGGDEVEIIRVVSGG